MDTRTLVREDIKSGKELIKHFDHKGLDIKIAFWFLDEEIDRWYLFISTSSVESEGSREVYRSILYAMKGFITEIRFEDIKVISYDSKMAKIFRSAIHTEKNTLEPIRFQGNVINGLYIKDALIYRVN